MQTCRTFSSEIFSGVILLAALSVVLGSLACESGGGDNTTAQVVWRGLNTPCGESLSDGNLGGSPDYAFVGYERENALNLLDADARFYQPAICRLNSLDPELQSEELGLNPYQYAGNNPIKNVDPDGRWFGPVWGAAMARRLSQQRQSSPQQQERLTSANFPVQFLGPMKVLIAGKSFTVNQWLAGAKPLHPSPERAAYLKMMPSLTTPKILTAFSVNVVNADGSKNELAPVFLDT